MEQLRQQITTLKADRQTYLEREKDLLKRQGTVETLERLKKELAEMEEKLAIQKDKMKELRRQREESLRSVCLQITDRINPWLSEGEASIEITEKGIVRIGWIINRRYHPLDGLSGGERVEFLQALSHVLGNRSDGTNKTDGLKLNFIELAEAGIYAGNILKQITEASSNEIQTIACNCYPMEDIPEGWEVIRL